MREDSILELQETRDLKTQKSRTGVKPRAFQTDVDPAPGIFSYLDYRLYLKDFYQYKKSLQESFSLAVFSKKAGITTRNYLKRVMDGDRPLSSESIPKFCLGLGLSSKEKLYFEALVNFNQSKDTESKKHYFSALREASKDIRGSAVEIVQDQFEVYSHWYILPIRELVLLEDFKEDFTYISKKLKNKISRKQAQSALEVLIRLGLLVRDEGTRKLKPAHPILRYDAGIVNLGVREFHKQTLDRTKEAIAEDEFDSWDIQSLSLAVSLPEIKEIQTALKEFIHELNLQFSNASSSASEKEKEKKAVILLNTQTIQITK